MKKRKMGKRTHGKLWNKRQHIKATQTKPEMDRRPGRNAMIAQGKKKHV